MRLWLQISGNIRMNCLFSQGRDSPVPDELAAEVDKADPDDQKIAEILARTRKPRMEGNAAEAFMKWPILNHMKHVSSFLHPFIYL